MIFYSVLLSFIYAVYFVCFFFFKQKTAYEMRISDWSSDVCSSDLVGPRHAVRDPVRRPQRVDPDEPAAAGALGIRLCAGRRQRGSPPAGLPAPARLAGRTFRLTRSATQFPRTFESMSGTHPDLWPLPPQSAQVGR